MSQNSTILLVEDEEHHLDLLRKQIEPVVRCCLVARNGQEAWEYLIGAEGREIELVVCDMRMPVMNGYELFQRVRASGMDLPFVFLSAWSDKAASITSLKHVFCEFLEKPTGFDRIVDTLQRGLKAGRGIRRLKAG